MTTPVSAQDINFDLRKGATRRHAPSDDPILSARSAVYSQSYTRRAGEQKQQRAPRLAGSAEAEKGE